MVVTNLSEFGTSGSLISAANPIIMNFKVNSPYQPVFVAEVKVSILPNAFLVTETLATVELLNYRTEGTDYYFTADIQSIVSQLFTKLDDHTISADTYEELTDNIYDIYIDYRVSNGVDADVTDGCQFTAFNAAVQYGSSPVICTNRNNVAADTTTETVYAGNSNVVYLYCFTADYEQPVVQPFAENILIDSDRAADGPANKDFCLVKHCFILQGQKF